MLASVSLEKRPFLPFGHSETKLTLEDLTLRGEATLFARQTFKRVC